MTDPLGAAPHSMKNLDNFIEGLGTAAWRTAGARYNASRRLRRRDLFGTLSIGVFSAIGIAIAIVEKVYGFPVEGARDKLLSATSICIGLFVIVISLLEWGVGCAVRAEALFKNAEELNSFRRRVELLRATATAEHPISAENADAATKEYEQVKASCPYNHEPVDERLFVATHRLSPEMKFQGMGLLSALMARLHGAVSGLLYLGALWVVLGVLLWIAYKAG